jgi:hypothetical protein
MLRVYYDNNIDCALSLSDLKPVEEMQAVLGCGGVLTHRPTNQSSASPIGSAESAVSDDPRAA